MISWPLIPSVYLVDNKHFNTDKNVSFFSNNSAILHVDIFALFTLFSISSQLYFGKVHNLSSLIINLITISRCFVSLFPNLQDRQSAILKEQLNTGFYFGCHLLFFFYPYFQPCRIPGREKLHSFCDCYQVEICIFKFNAYAIRTQAT